VRLRTTMVQKLASQSERQRRRNDAKEKNSVHYATRTSRIQSAESAIGQDEMQDQILRGLQ